MTKRENILKILRRQGGGYIPFDFYFCPRLQGEFEEAHGAVDVAEFYDFDHREVGLNPSRLKPDFSRYYRDRTLKEGHYFDSNGVAHEPGPIEHFTHRVSPLAGRGTTVRDIEEYPIDDTEAGYRYEGLADRVAGTQNNGYAVSALAGHTFETAWPIRGMEDFLMDLYEKPEVAHAILERVTEKNIVAARKFAEAGVDILRFGDDVATQIGMMMSPDVWREFLKRRLARQIRAAREANPDILIFYHSDGDIRAIIPDLIEIGLDILNPVQPECLDPVSVKRQYGDELSFWGTIGTQSTMPFGTPDEVKDTVKRMIREVGRNGGLVLAPTHMLEPEVPWENIHAFVTACREYGRRV
jgi:uroporphyrinogen decarboxylase